MRLAPFQPLGDVAVSSRLLVLHVTWLNSAVLFLFSLLLFWPSSWEESLFKPEMRSNSNLMYRNS